MEAKVWYFSDIKTAHESGWTLPLYANVYDGCGATLWTHKGDAVYQAALVKPAYRLNIQLKAA